MSRNVKAEVRWEAPAPGQWAIDRSHMPAGCTPLVQHIVNHAMPAGMRRMFHDLGAPIDTLDTRFVHGQMYTRLRPLIAPDRPSAKLPPMAVLRLATRLHPEMRRRNRTAGRVRVSEPWVDVIAPWHAHDKAMVVSQNLALQHVDLTGLDDVALIAHVQACVEHCERSWERHFWMHGYDMGPLGQYLFEAGAWGLDADELLGLLEGASPSTSAPGVAAQRIRAEVDRTGAAPGTLDELRALSPEISSAVDEFLAHRSAVLFSRYDLDGVTFGERPDLVLASILTATPRDTGPAVAARTAAVRERVPAEHRERFDRILGQARDAMDLRDDNGPTTAEWPLGLLRLALLEVGRRLVARDGLTDAALALEIEPHEIDIALLRGRPGETALRERARVRASQKLLDPPRKLGPAEAAPPDGVLPANLAYLVGMVQTVMLHMGMDGGGTAGGMRGSGIGTEIVRGRACVASSPEEALDLLEPGDVLVVAGTTPAYNLVLSLAGAVVTAEGGPMSHAAVIARELGIPAVIGAHGALTDIPNGALIEVDPVAGEVRVLTTDADERQPASS